MTVGSLGSVTIGLVVVDLGPSSDLYLGARSSDFCRNELTKEFFAPSVLTDCLTSFFALSSGWIGSSIAELTYIKFCLNGLIITKFSLADSTCSSRSIRSRCCFSMVLFDLTGEADV